MPPTDSLPICTERRHTMTTRDRVDALDRLDPDALIRVARGLDDPPADEGDDLGPVELVEIARGIRPMPPNRKDS